MKRILIMMCICFICFSQTVYASDYLSQTQEQKQKTLTRLVDKISKDMGINTTPNLYFYSCKEWYVVASYYDGLNYIYINTSAFDDTTEADALGLTLDQYIVKTLAHEIRHDYQYEHMFDDTEYGKAVKANKDNYIPSYNENYQTQFIEQDAEQYAIDYMNKYFK